MPHPGIAYVQVMADEASTVTKYHSWSQPNLGSSANHTTYEVHLFS